MSALERDELGHEREAPSVAEPAPAEREHEHDDPVRDLASTVGNQAFTHAVARDGAGILPNGTVHPAVQHTLDMRRGSGAPLPENAQARFGESLGDVSDVRVHTDAEADALARSVSARAFAVGPDVYFAGGEYQPGSSGGDRLLAHELTHVAQQRDAPSAGPLAVSQPGDAHEREADSTADELAGP
jgi:Domain of unknown function (DUF4157)